MCERQRALQPFIFAIVLSSKRQASLPYVSRLHTAVLHILSFSHSGTAAEPNTARRSPHLDIAIAHLFSTSRSCAPSAVKSDPRYLNLKTVSSFSPSHCTGATRSCASSTLSLRTFRSARVPVKFCSLHGAKRQAFRCMRAPCAFLHGRSQCGQRTPVQLNEFWFR